MSHKLIDIVEQKHMKRQLPEFHIGDTVDVHTRIREGAKERIQVFNGVVIARSGRGLGESCTVRRIVNNEGVERIFLLHSPLVVDIRIKRRARSGGPSCTSCVVGWVRPGACVSCESARPRWSHPSRRPATMRRRVPPHPSPEPVGSGA